MAKAETVGLVDFERKSDVKMTSVNHSHNMNGAAVAATDDNDNSNNNDTDTNNVPNSPSPPNEYRLTPLDTPVTGQSDWREFRCFALENGVTVCLVHDKESKTTAAAATVNAGAAADPRSLPGLAHFCEHMVFLGSSKYPGENEYKSFLAQHGGRSNASTSMHLTTFKFEILAAHAEHAIDIFTNFFVAPLFTLSGTSREVQAVDSENSKNLTADVRRRLQILKSLARPEHWYAKFSTGNSQTLRSETDEQVQELRQALAAFHAQHYRPDQLTVVVAGPQSLDELQEWVVPRLAPMRARVLDKTKTAAENDENVQNTNVSSSSTTASATLTHAEQLVQQGATQAPLYRLQDILATTNDNGENNQSSTTTFTFNSPFVPGTPRPWPLLVTTKPVRSVRQLVLQFPLPSVHTVPDQSPASVLSHLLGHEGPHSPFAVLQNAGLLSSLSAGIRAAGPDFTFFQINMGLTEQGEEHWKRAVDVVLQHCRLIAQQAATEQGVAELRRIWTESVTLRNMFFDQTSPGSVYDLAPRLASSIVRNGTRKAVSAGSMLDQGPDTFPAAGVAEFAARLVLDNCLMERCSQQAWEEMETAEKEKASAADDTTTVERRTEQWYNVDYFVSSFSANDVASWTDETGATSFLNARDQLALPRPNRYIPRTLELCHDLPAEARAGPHIEQAIDPPHLLVHEPGLARMWHRLDDRYALPKSVITLLIRNAAVNNIKITKTTTGNDVVDDAADVAAAGETIWVDDTKAAVHSSILSGMFAEALAQETYDADLAGLHWSLSLTASGIRISCSGFSDRLPDLALHVLQEFLSGDFLKSAKKESFFHSTKDRVVRSLQTFFESRRADAHASYYRDFLLASCEEGIEASLRETQLATLAATQEHHGRLLANDEALVECLFTGNVSKDQAQTFFDQALDCLKTGTRMGQGQHQQQQPPLLDAGGAASASSFPPPPPVWIPASLERRLGPREDVELHFSSQNPQEENGAVLVTYQSPIPGYRGSTLSSDESLKSSSAIRLLCHILREPLFNELRTKQTLGYIVSGFFDVAYSSEPDQLSPQRGDPFAVPVDYIVINVLSRKVAPPEVARRIDEFLVSFRQQTLVNMPDSEIAHHAHALSTKLQKPIQKLSTEASQQFTKIMRHSPEVFLKNTQGRGGRGARNDMPWDNAPAVANTVESLTREDLLQAWDRMIPPESRARIVSCVYGSTFSLPDDLKSTSISQYGNNQQRRRAGQEAPLRIVNDLNGIIRLRERLSVFGPTATPQASRLLRGGGGALAFLSSLPKNRNVMAGVAATVLFGAAGWTLLSRSKKLSK